MNGRVCEKGADMRLADFILRGMETILAQWEAFAATRLSEDRRSFNRNGSLSVKNSSIGRA